MGAYRSLSRGYYPRLLPPSSLSLHPPSPSFLPLRPSCRLLKAASLPPSVLSFLSLPCRILSSESRRGMPGGSEEGPSDSRRASLLPFISGACHAPIGSYRPPKIFDFWVSYCLLVGDSISVPFSSPPESSARMGSAESEVGSTAAELQVILTFLMNAHRPHSARSLFPAEISKSLCEFGDCARPFALRF